MQHQVLCPIIKFIDMLLDITFWPFIWELHYVLLFGKGSMAIMIFDETLFECFYLK